MAISNDDKPNTAVHYTIISPLITDSRVIVSLHEWKARLILSAERKAVQSEQKAEAMEILVVAQRNVLHNMLKKSALLNEQAAKASDDLAKLYWRFGGTE